MTSIPATQRVRWLDSLYLSDVDWSATQAFPLISDSCAVRFNVVGREPEGTVQPADYDAFRAELAEEFAALEDADTGRLLVDRVLTTEEALGCPPRDSFPDLAVQWHRGQPVRAIRSPSLGEFEVEHTDNRTSIHRTPGFLIASGAGIPPSGETRLDGPPIRLVDVGATALAWLGVDQPATLTGRAVPPLAPAKTSA
jgi:predicted AlkP superfamily phosphohydrolase/phosphomutase